MRRGLPMLAAAVAAVLVVLSLLGRARLTGLSGQCLELEERIAALEEENARLLIEHETAYSAQEWRNTPGRRSVCRAPRADR